MGAAGQLNETDILTETCQFSKSETVQESQHLPTKLEAKNLLLKSENSHVSISHHNADSQTAHNEQQVSEIVTCDLSNQTAS